VIVARCLAAALALIEVRAAAAAALAATTEITVVAKGITEAGRKAEKIDLPAPGLIRSGANAM
jgi:hypothetical protein